MALLINTKVLLPSKSNREETFVVTVESKLPNWAKLRLLAILLLYSLVIGKRTKYAFEKSENANTNKIFDEYKINVCIPKVRMFVGFD